MRKKFTLIIYLTSICFAFLYGLGSKAYAQTGSYTVKGTVTDDKGGPLPGAKVKVAGSSIGAVTDASGVFTLTLLLPIPLTEIQLNKDAILEQNPGY